MFEAGYVSAFDAHLIGIDPDYRLHVSEQLLSPGLFNACYSPLYERLMAGSRAAAHRASAILVTPLARAMLSA